MSETATCALCHRPTEPTATRQTLAGAVCERCYRAVHPDRFPLTCCTCGARDGDGPCEGCDRPICLRCSAGRCADCGAVFCRGCVRHCIDCDISICAYCKEIHAGRCYDCYQVEEAPRRVRAERAG